jgi:NAD(P)H-flavin reductase
MDSFVSNMYVMIVQFGFIALLKFNCGQFAWVEIRFAGHYRVPFSHLLS